MNDQIDQPQKSFLKEREGIQEVGEEQLEDISGGLLDTPGRGVLRRSDSAPGLLQGNQYPGEVLTLPNSPTPSSPTVETAEHHPLMTQRLHPDPQQITLAPDHVIIDGITRRFH